VSYRDIRTVIGERVYVIGDIHGCIRETEALLTHLERKEKLSEKDLVVFLGDYIDRGADSRQVIEMMLNFRRRYPGTVYLKGNHEDMFLDYLGFGGRLGEVYLQNGGVETVHSYGVSVYDYPDIVSEAMPAEHLKFLQELEAIVKIEDFLCVHAGLDPEKAILEQADDALFWIREEFINSIHEFEHTVLFGHTPFKELLVHLPYKIGLDTGLVYGNKLSCLELSSGMVFQVSRNSTRVKRTTLKKLI